MKPTMRIDTFKAVMLFLCIIVVCFVLTALASMVIVKIPDMTMRVRYLTIAQDLLLFILPPIATAMVATRYPARLLAIDTAPPLKPLLLSVATLAAVIPAMNWLVVWNESLSLPASMASLEQSMRQAEEQASELISTLIGGASVGSLVMSLLIVCVLAGFSEEIFFRGCLQRLLTPKRGGAHAAVWTAAFIFSAIHFQFFGFVPRLLLGAWFGYLLVWTRSLWVPVIIHTLNNSTVVVSKWIENRSGSTASLDAVGSEPGQWWLVVLSIAATAVLLRLTYKTSRQ